MTHCPRDPHRILASLTRDRASLELKTVELCFLTALQLRAEQATLVSFEEETLLEVFEQICDLVEPSAESPRRRATHAIRRLREQRLLARVDGAGLVSAGEYALSRLARGIVEFYLEEEVLTRESLTLLTTTLLSSLAEIRAAARRARTEAEWRSEVVAPLRVTVADLVAGIERRQRGLDVQQEDVQKRIAELLKADWFGAVEQCQSLLDDTATTLRELNEVLLRDASHMQMLLQEIQQSADESSLTDVAEVVQRVIEQVERVAVWGTARQRAWSVYYQYVHRYLRDVVRLDPERALSQRLRDQLAGFTSRPFSLIAAGEGSIRLLRPETARVARPAVKRTQKPRERDLETVAPEDLRAALERRVRLALASGASSLAKVTDLVLADVDPPVRYLVAGRVAALVAELTRADCDHERPWVPVAGNLEIEDWRVDGNGLLP